MSHPNSSKIVDAIPLFELEEVLLMHEDAKDTSRSDEMSKRYSATSLTDQVDKKMSDRKNAKSNKLRFSHSFQLRTIAEGYNSGRQYIIQANSFDERQALVVQIRKLAKVSRELYLAKSKFLKAQANFLDSFLFCVVISGTLVCIYRNSPWDPLQEFVRKYYKSTFVQSLVALLIVLVVSSFHGA